MVVIVAAVAAVVVAAVAVVVVVAVSAVVVALAVVGVSLRMIPCKGANLKGNLVRVPKRATQKDGRVPGDRNFFI